MSVVAGPVTMDMRKRTYPFWTGAASIAAALTHPLDVAKVRLQTSNAKGVIDTMIKTYKNDDSYATGIWRGVYAGLTASLLRQATYSTVRFGSYDYIRSNILPAPGPSGRLPILYLIGASSTAGVLGGVWGNGADIVLVRMVKDHTLPLEQRYGYKNAIDGMLQIMIKEGPLELFRGWIPNATRAALMNTGQLATYDEVKRALKHNFGISGIPLHFASSVVSGTVATTICAPFDVIKSRVMGSQDKGVLMVLRESIKNEGLHWAFRGWLPAWARLGPNTVAVL